MRWFAPLCMMAFLLHQLLDCFQVTPTNVDFKPRAAALASAADFPSAVREFGIAFDLRAIEALTAPPPPPLNSLISSACTKHPLLDLRTAAGSPVGGVFVTSSAFAGSELHKNVYAFTQLCTVRL